MGAASCHGRRLAIALALGMTVFGMPGRASADPADAVYPGMQIRQGSAVCMVGMVEPKLRVALTTGQCDGGESVVTDGAGNVIGSVLSARRQAGADTAADHAIQPVEYEVIALAPDVSATDLLPTGRRLRSSPDLRAEPGLPVCRLRGSAVQVCGAVSSVSNGRIVLADMADVADVAADRGDLGGPVYALGDGDEAVIVGLVEGTWRSSPEVESWQAVMKQVYLDSQAGQQPPSGVQVISRSGSALARTQGAAAVSAAGAALPTV